jgi:hypothetical protein
MNKKSRILRKYFNYNLLYYAFALYKNSLCSNSFFKNLKNYPISHTWFKKVAKLINSQNFNYKMLDKTPNSINKLTKNKIKCKIIEISFLLLLTPYFPFVSFNSISLSNFVSIL